VEKLNLTFEFLNV